MNGTYAKKTVTRHEFTAKDNGHGIPITDITDIVNWAYTEATKLGVNTGSDDWARFRTPCDDELVLVFETVDPEKKEPF
ncbi:hypothetical protein SEA_MACGULLY_4 [Rhodococcus phage MacGully]|nr:hypothetical protein SEA_MACGULLY_4 [Rhodococcus phage MacGully]